MDIPLTTIDQAGLKTILKNKTQLSKISFDKVYCSTLMRTQETALIHGYSNFIIETKLNELNFGKYEGKAKNTMSKEDGDLWRNNPRQLVLGEKLSSFFLRIDDFIKSQTVENILVFSHGAIMRYIKAKYILKDINQMNQFKIDNGELMEIKI